MTKAQKTRLDILKMAMSVIYKNGYQAASIDEILKNLRVTKGAFFYHFKTKEEMCLSMIEEVIQPNIHKIWIAPLENSNHLIKDMLKHLRVILYDEEMFDVRFGCPTINLIEEVSPHSASLRKQLRTTMVEWIGGLEQVLQSGKDNGTVDSLIIPKDAANFIVSGYAGARGMGKLFGTSAYETYLQGLDKYFKN